MVGTKYEGAERLLPYESISGRGFIEFLELVRENFAGGSSGFEDLFHSHSLNMRKMKPSSWWDSYRARMVCCKGGSKSSDEGDDAACCAFLFVVALSNLHVRFEDLNLGEDDLAGFLVREFCTQKFGVWCGVLAAVLYGLSDDPVGKFC